MSRDAPKRHAAARALEFVSDGMKLGLGSGSTAAIFVSLLAERVRREGLSLECVATSRETQQIAERENLSVTTLESTGRLDLTIDGADEIDPALNLIKGGGGAHLREKIVAWASRRLVIIADAGKQVPVLGKFPLPVEIIPFACRPIREEIAQWEAPYRSGPPRVRTLSDGSPFVTDEGNHILDCSFGQILDPAGLARRIESIPGVVAHGLFLGMAELAVLGNESGAQILSRQ